MSYTLEDLKSLKEEQVDLVLGAFSKTDIYFGRYIFRFSLLPNEKERLVYLAAEDQTNSAEMIGLSRVIKDTSSLILFIEETQEEMARAAI